MKALSCKQPWASMLLNLEKSIETRPRNTSHRGLFVLHSSKQPDQEAMKYYKKSDLPNGVLLGILNLIDIVKYDSFDSWYNDKERTKCYWTPYGLSEKPKYGYIIGPDIIKFKNPIPHKGNLGFWNVPNNVVGASE